MRPVPELLYPFLKREEKAVMRVYDDGAPKRVLKPGSPIIGTLTAGIGHTGPDVKIGLEVTQAQVDQWLRKDVETARRRLYSVVPPDVIDELTEHQYAALLSFVFNTGCGSPKKPAWGIWGALKARRFEAVPAELSRFVWATMGGKKVKLPGLVNRRNAEIALWSIEEPGTAPEPLAVVPSSVTREVETPPADPPPKPMAKASAAAKIGAAATGTLAAANELKDVVEPNAYHSDALQKVLVLLVLVIVLASVAIWIFQEKRRKA